MISVTVSLNCMEAAIRLDIADPDRKKIGYSDIVNYIKQYTHIDESMIDYKAIEQFAENKIYNTRVVIARGIPPTLGTDGYLKWHFNTLKGIERIATLDTSKGDFKHFVLYDTVERNQLLVSIEPPVPGQPGKDLFGVRVEAPMPQSAALPAGRFVVLSSDKTQMFAARSGRADYTDGVVEVFDCLYFNGNLDASAGKIDCAGDVCIEGNLQAGTNISARGNIEVHGVVEGVSIQAQGDIIIRGGVQAVGKGMIIAGGNVYAQFLEHATVEAAADIVAQYLLHSNVFCGGSIQLISEPGSIVGGNTVAGKQIQAKTVGSDTNMPTLLEVGIHPRYRERKIEIERETEQINEEILQLLNLAKTLPNGNETDTEKDLRIRITRNLIDLRQRMILLGNEQEEIDKRSSSFVNGQVRVLESLYKGCVVTIGENIYKIGQDAGPMEFI